MRRVGYKNSTINQLSMYTCVYIYIDLRYSVWIQNIIILYPSPSPGCKHPRRAGAAGSTSPVFLPFPSSYARPLLCAVPAFFFLSSVQDVAT